MIHLKTSEAADRYIKSQGKRWHSQPVSYSNETIGKELSPTEFKKFLDVVNKPRPYSSFDFKKQHFIPDLD